MEHYQLIKIAHSAVAVLVLLGLLAHVFMLWKAQRSGDAGVLQRKLKRTRFISMPVLALLALTLPFSGYWMVDMTGLPLSQMWLLASSLLFALLVILGLLLSGRLRVWLALGETPASTGLKRLCMAYAVLIIILLIAIMGLMGAKPV
ncbi:DUF2269 family protein [Pseudomonas segetis]|uniref:Uncharacterized membrane protein n=1 Tax=Pseudomonas segetis TaxID=298908 RepID=A0A239IHK3_9PSED|nr:DUF2269 family protein [Pseudomonas segetis]SNS93130.1 Uncharacterized membrane protein [Pseudomonas segetis]